MKRIIVCAAICFASATALSADTVHLKNGTIVSGKILRDDYTSVSIKTSEGTKNYSQQEVSEVEYDLFRNVYLRFMLGYSYQKYDGELDTFNNWKQDAYPAFFGELGFYIGHPGRGSVFGVTLLSTSYGTLKKDGDKVSIQTGTTMGTWILYLDSIYSGLFFEGSVGVGQITVKTNPQNGTDKTYKSHYSGGLACKLGLGYAFETNPWDSAVILQVNWLYVTTEADGIYKDEDVSWRSGSINASVGFLF